MKLKEFFYIILFVLDYTLLYAIFEMRKDNCDGVKTWFGFMSFIITIALIKLIFDYFKENK